jgi:hypothetical protein
MTASHDYRRAAAAASAYDYDDDADVAVLGGRDPYAVRSAVVLAAYDDDDARTTRRY